MYNNPTPYQKQAPEAISRMRTFVLILSGIVYGLYALVLAPIYTQLSANVVYQDTLVTTILYYLLPALDLAVFMGVYAAVIYAIWRGGFRKAWSVPLAFVLMTLGKYLLNFFMTCLTDGGFPSFDIFMEEDLPLMAQSLLLEYLQLALVVLSATLVCHRRLNRYHQAMLSSAHPTDERPLAFPMKKMISFKNPTQWSALMSSLILLLGRWYMHAVYQLALIVFNGEPDSMALIVFDFTSDLLIAVVAYFVMILLLSYFDRKDMERLAEH